MKKKTYLITLFVLIAISAFAAEHYAYMLSCGKTVYRDHAYVLSDEELLNEVDALEKQYCGS